MDPNTTDPTKDDEHDPENTETGEPESGAGYGNHAGQPPVPEKSQ